MQASVTMGASRDDYIRKCRRGQSLLGSVCSGHCPHPVTCRQLVAGAHAGRPQVLLQSPAAQRAHEELRTECSHACASTSTLFVVILTMVFYLMTVPHP